MQFLYTIRFSSGKIDFHLEKIDSSGKIGAKSDARFGISIQHILFAKCTNFQTFWACLTRILGFRINVQTVYAGAFSFCSQRTTILDPHSPPPHPVRRRFRQKRTLSINVSAKADDYNTTVTMVSQKCRRNIAVVSLSCRVSVDLIVTEPYTTFTMRRILALDV